MKPIIFSTPMVQAILAGRKSQTRRVIKPQPSIDCGGRFDWEVSFADGSFFITAENENGDGAMWKYKPRYQQGDVLWVRETWCELARVDSSGYTHYDDCNYYYATDGDYQIDLCDADGFYLDDQRMRWRPSIHMPRAAARMFLRVTDVRVERMQEISEGDAIAEGCEGIPCDHPSGRYACEDCMNTGWREPPIVMYHELWDELNAKRGYGWDTNPWVWVITFERIDEPEEGE